MRKLPLLSYKDPFSLRTGTGAASIVGENLRHPIRAQTLAMCVSSAALTHTAQTRGFNDVRIAHSSGGWTSKVGASVVGFW